MKKQIYILTLLGLIVVSLLYIGCNKSNDNSGTCSDGIQNQSETGIDCGGPCSPCTNPLCDGNGSNTYWPLAQGNRWSFDDGARYEVEGTETYMSQSYFKVNYYLGATFIDYTYYFRVDASGNIYAYYTEIGEEHLFIPASPSNGQVISDFTGQPVLLLNRTVIDIDFDDVFDIWSCNYDNILAVDNISSSTGNSIHKDFYIRGLGPIGHITKVLESVELN